MNTSNEPMIPRPDISVAQIILLILAETGRANFKRIKTHALVHALGAVRSENSFYTALARLKRRRLISRTADHSYELTAQGEYASLKAYVRKEFTEREKELETSNLKLEKPREGRVDLQTRLATSEGQRMGKLKVQSWDGRWRIVIFDVPESQRPVRDYIRSVLKRVGFYEFQRSMWIYPHKLPGFLLKMIDDPKMRKYARVLTTYDIDYDEDLRRQFKLA